MNINSIKFKKKTSTDNNNVYNENVDCNMIIIRKYHTVPKSFHKIVDKKVNRR